MSSLLVLEVPLNPSLTSALGQAFFIADTDDEIPLPPLLSTKGIRPSLS